MQTPYGTSTVTSSDHFTFTTGAGSVAGRFLFYNQSAFDGNSAVASTSDNGAIATDKSAYLPGTARLASRVFRAIRRGSTASWLNLAGSGTHGSINAATILNDFTFKLGTNNTPSDWATAPSPISVSVRTGAGVGGSDRVDTIWANGAIQKTWLEVIVKSTADTGLQQLAGAVRAENLLW